MNYFKKFVLAFVLLFTLGIFFTSQTYAQSPRVYVANSGSNTVSVVDSGTNEVVHTISVGTSPRGLMVSPDKSRVYVANFDDDTISVINSSDYSTITTIPVGDGPTGMAITQNGTQLYVADYNENKVTVIDATSNSVVDDITVAANPWNMSMTADTSRLYVSSGPSSSVAAIDTTTNAVISTTSIVHASGIAVMPDGSRLYVANGGEGTVQVFNTADMSEITTIIVAGSGSSTGKAAMNLSGTRAIVTLNGSGSVAIINTTNNTVVATIAVGTEPNGVAFTPNGAFAYIANNSSNTVSVIDLGTNAVVETLSVGVNPIAAEAETSLQLTALDPAKVWVGVSNIFQAGVRFDLKAEVYKDSTLVSSGQINTFNPGNTGLFATANLATIPFASFSAASFSAGSELKVTVSVRNACAGSFRNQGVARLWYNDNQADSHFGATIASSASGYYLRDLFALATTAGPGPKKAIDVQSGAKCSAFKTFGTWTVTP